MSTVVRQSLRFVSVGALNTAVGLSTIFLLMLLLNVGPALANVLGYAVGFALSFALNRAWTFGSTRHASHDFPRYFLVAAACYALNLALVIALTSQNLMNAYAAQVLGVAVYTVCSFLGFRFLVFAPRTAP